MLPDRASSDLSREAGLKIRPLDVARRDILIEGADRTRRWHLRRPVVKGNRIVGKLARHRCGVGMSRFGTL